MSSNSQSAGEFKEKIIKISRVAKVVKGGRRFSFSALCVIGNDNGTIGFGLGKAGEVTVAISKAVDRAKKNIVSINIDKFTIPHDVVGKFGATKVLMFPASEGTGVIAGGAARAIIEVSGIRDILTKIVGSRNPHNVVKATFKGLTSLLDHQYALKARGKA